MAGSFAAVIGGRLKNVGVAVIIGLLLGVANGVVNRYVPANSSLKPDITASVPFVFIVIALLYNIRGRNFASLGESRGALDVAIKPVGDQQLRSSADAQKPVTSHTRAGFRGVVGLLGANSAPIGIMVVIAVLPLVLTGLWLGQVGIGLAFGIAFLSFTLVTGEGGMIWLCEITFAGFGAVFTAYLASHGWSVIPAMLVAATITAPIGIIVGLLTVRLGSLYVALVTLTFGFLVDSLIFTLNIFDNYGSGVSLARPSFAQSDRAFAYVVLGIFCVSALLIFNLRNSTAGLALNAARSSETATRMLGFNVSGMRILLSGAAAFVAAIGGALLASAAGAAIPASYATLGGLVWLAVLVTIGVRSTVAAAVAGLSFALLPVVFQNYLPVAYASVPAALFGIGAVLVVRNPDGVGATHGRQFRALVAAVKRNIGKRGVSPIDPDSSSASLEPPRSTTSIGTEVASQPAAAALPSGPWKQRT
jgi:branched-chain amino acid transport system permease protein